MNGTQPQHEEVQPVGATDARSLARHEQIGFHSIRSSDAASGSGSASEGASDSAGSVSPDSSRSGLSIPLAAWLDTDASGPSGQSSAAHLNRVASPTSAVSPPRTTPLGWGYYPWEETDQTGNYYIGTLRGGGGGGGFLSLGNDSQLQQHVRNPSSSRNDVDEAFERLLDQHITWPKTTSFRRSSSLGKIEWRDTIELADRRLRKLDEEPVKVRLPTQPDSSARRASLDDDVRDLLEKLHALELGGSTTFADLRAALIDVDFLTAQQRDSKGELADDAKRKGREAVQRGFQAYSRTQQFVNSLTDALQSMKRRLTTAARSFMGRFGKDTSDEPACGTTIRGARERPDERVKRRDRQDKYIPRRPSGSSVSPYTTPSSLSPRPSSRSGSPAPSGQRRATEQDFAPDYSNSGGDSAPRPLEVNDTWKVNSDPDGFLLSEDVSSWTPMV